MTNNTTERKWTHRPTAQAHKALSDFCRSAGNRCPVCQARHMERGETIHIFSIPVDFERDADFILGDVIEERDALIERVKVLQGEITFAVELLDLAKALIPVSTARDRISIGSDRLRAALTKEGK